jgi:predicted SAM-dependent methyltransferase
MWRRILIFAGLVGAGLSLGGVSGPWLKLRIEIASAPHQMDTYLQSHPVRKLQIGAGGADYPSWLNTDIEPSPEEVYLDATQHFPLPDGSIEYIFAEHVIEHLTYEQGLGMLRECHRVLAPGGKIRLATPNLLKYFALFQEPVTEEMKHYVADKLMHDKWPESSRPAATIMNLEFRSFGHQFLYDPATLSDSLAQKGFQTITQFHPGESDDPQLRGIEMRHNNRVVRDANDYESMVLQAVRR